MGDSQNLDQLKTQYRRRFYRDRVEDLPELSPGTNVLSAIKDYFNDLGSEESPGLRRSSFFADSATNINVGADIQKRQSSSRNTCTSKLNLLPSKGSEESLGFRRSSFFADCATNINVTEIIQKTQSSSRNTCTSKLNLLPCTGELNENKIKTAKSPAVDKKMKTPTYYGNVNVVSEEEMNNSDSNTPLNLVVEKNKTKETKTVRSVSNESRDRLYSSDCSVVQGPPSPTSKSSPKKRLRFSEAVVNDRESFASVFASKYKRGPTDDDDDDDDSFPLHESVNYIGSKTDQGPSIPDTECLGQKDEEFVIEDEHSINMSFSSENKRSSFGSSKETKSTASSSTHRSQTLQRKVSKFFSEPSPFSLKRSSQTTTKENSPNVYRMGTTDESKNLLSPKETKMTPSSAASESKRLSMKPQDISEQLFPYSETAQKTRQVNKELELSEEDLLYDTSTKIKIPRAKKSIANRPSSSCVSHQVLNVESAEDDSEQSTVQSQKKNTLSDEKTNKRKATLCKDNNSFTSYLVKMGNNEPPVKRVDASDYSKLPVMVEDDEFVIQDITDVGIDSQSWNKKTHKIPNNIQKNKKREKRVPSEVLNVTYTSARKSDSIVTESRESPNDPTDSSSPYKGKKKKKRPTEVDKLALQKYLQADIDDLNNRTFIRSKRASAPPSSWWVVKQHEMNSALDTEEASPQGKGQSSAEASMEPLEFQNDEEEIFEHKEREPPDQEEKSVKEKNEKSLKTLKTRKKAKKLKSIEKEEMAGPSKVRMPKNPRKKSQTSTKKSLKPTKVWEQQEHEAQESNAENSNEHGLHVNDLPNEIASLTTEMIPGSPVNDPQCSSPQRQDPNLEECSQNSSSESNIRFIRLGNEEEEPQAHDGPPKQSDTSPVNDSAKLTFQSGPVKKTRAVRHNNEIDPVVRNLASNESLNNAGMSSMAVVFNPDTGNDALAECIHYAERRMANPLWKCFNNEIFSTGKMKLRSMEMEARDEPKCDILIFYVVKGRVMLKLHKSYHSLKPGDFFFIPPGNKYQIQNYNREEAELVFTHLKSVSQ